MTEMQVRQRVVDAMNGWLGSIRGDAKHLDILNTYNSHKPLARGYTVLVKDNHCATTASAAYIKAGIAAYTGTECSCGEWIKIAKAKGIWVENDAYTPQIGDAIIYAWSDSGVGDNTSGHDHVGIVSAVSGNSFTVTEGNMTGGKVWTRSMTVNGRYIRGYICPPFAKIAADLTAKEKPDVAAILSALTNEQCAEIVKRGLAHVMK